MILKIDSTLTFNKKEIQMTKDLTFHINNKLIQFLEMREAWKRAFVNI